MTTLADVKAGQQILFACAVTAVDTAYRLALYGPGAVSAGTVAIDTVTGTITGALAHPASQVPVTVVSGFAPVSVNDVLASAETGETLVARATWVSPDGRCMWSPSPSRTVAYTADGWAKVGTATIP